MTQCLKRRCDVSRKDEPAGSGAPPLLHPSLECPDLPVREDSGQLDLEALKEFLPRSIRLRIQPCAHTKPDIFERTFARSPVAPTLGLCTMRGANFPLLPSRPETLEKLIERSVPLRRHVWRSTRGESCEMVLDRANLVQQTKRVEGVRDLPKALFHILRNRCGREQPSARCRRSVVPLRDPGPLASLLRELERRLEEIHEEARRGVETRKGLRVLL